MNKPISCGAQPGGWPWRMFTSMRICLRPGSFLSFDGFFAGLFDGLDLLPQIRKCLQRLGQADIRHVTAPGLQ